MGVLALRSWNHVSFPVRDLERSLRFYRDVFGLAAIARPDLPFPGAWLGGSNGIEVHLIVPPEGAPLGSPPPSLNPLGGHVAFAIDDYDAVVAALHGAGIETLEAGSATGQLWVRDPDGHLIELIRPGADRTGGTGAGR
jgi:glyoxylase I family protein